jgi:hypothetical protein
MTPLQTWRIAANSYNTARWAERGYVCQPHPVGRLEPCHTPHSDETRALALDALRAWTQIPEDQRRKADLRMVG